MVKMVLMLMLIGWNDSMDVVVDEHDGGVAIFPSQDNPEVLYMAHIQWDDDSLRILRSTDGGQTWGVVTSINKSYCEHLGGLAVIPGDTLFVSYRSDSDGLLKLLKLDSEGNIINSITVDTVVSYPTMVTDVEYYPSVPWFYIVYDTAGGIIKYAVYNKDLGLVGGDVVFDTAGENFEYPWIAVDDWSYVYIVARSSTTGSVWLYNQWTGFSGYFEYFDTTGGKKYYYPAIDVNPDGRILITAVDDNYGSIDGRLHYAWSTDWGSTWQVDSFVDTFRYYCTIPVVKNVPSDKWYIIANLYKNEERRLVAFVTTDISSGSWDTIDISYRDDIKVQRKYISAYYVPNQDLIVAWSVYGPSPYYTYFDREAGWTGIEEKEKVVSMPGLRIKIASVLKPYSDFALVLSKDANVSIKVLSIDGRVVSKIHSGLLSSGEHKFNIGNLKPGVYMLKVDANRTLVKKFVIAK